MEETFIPVSGNSPGYLEVPAYMLAELDPPESQPLTDTVVSPGHPITARKDVLQAAALNKKLRMKILKKDEASPTQKLIFQIVMLIIMAFAIIITAVVLDNSTGKTWWLFIFWGILLAFLVLSYWLIFF